MLRHPSLAGACVALLAAWHHLGLAWASFLLCVARSYEWDVRRKDGLNADHDVVVAAPRLGLFAAIPVRLPPWPPHPTTHLA